MKIGYAVTVLYLHSPTRFFLMHHWTEMYQSSLRYQCLRMILLSLIE